MNKKPGKILYWLHWFPAISETFILREILELQKLGEEIDVFAVNPSPDRINHPEVALFKGRVSKPYRALGNILKAHSYWISKKPSLYFGILGRIFRQVGHRKTFTVSLSVFCKAVCGAYSIKGKGYRHIHSHFGNAPATGAWIVSNLLEIPFSFTTHAIDIFIPDRLLQTKLNDAKFVATISNFNRGYLYNKFPSIDMDKIHVVRCGLNPDEFPFSEVGLPYTPARIISVGRIVPKKGFDYLLNAVKLIIESGRKVQLTIIGGGEGLDRLKSLATELGIDKNVVFAGTLSNDVVRDKMMESDLFVLACIQDKRGDMDGIPVVLMESLALGIPTVSTEISGIPELIKPFETGLLVPPSDPKALADAIRFYLAETELRKRLPIAGRKLVVDEFDITKNALKLRDLLR